MFRDQFFRSMQLDWPTLLLAPVWHWFAMYRLDNLTFTRESDMLMTSGHALMDCNFLWHPGADTFGNIGRTAGSRSEYYFWLLCC